MHETYTSIRIKYAETSGQPAGRGYVLHIDKCLRRELVRLDT
jgi:hypothetical protein